MRCYNRFCKLSGETMSAVYIATQSMSLGLRNSVMRLEAGLSRAQDEATSGRRADPGLALGGSTRRVIAIRFDSVRLTSQIETNKVASTRLSATQNVLSDIMEMAKALQNTLLQDHGDANARAASRQEAVDGLSHMASALNSAVGGRYLFGGVADDAAPVASPTANTAAVSSAFQAKFGIAPGAPGSSALSAADVQSFLDNDHAGLFDAANWSANWSRASDQLSQHRVAPHEIINTGATANDPAFRRLAQAMSMVADLGGGGLNDSAYQALTTKAASLLGEAISGVTQVSATIGVAQSQVDKASSQASVRIDLLAQAEDALLGVDAYEASTRVTRLQSQIQIAFQLTGQLRNLNLFDAL